jgi:hopene-associated glycosyltransferase HpnB
MTLSLFLAICTAAIWLYLLAARGGFWTASTRDDADTFAAPASWPSVLAVIPARNEVDVIARNIRALLTQDYPGRFGVILVDDQSSDGTAEAARSAAAEADASERLTVLAGQPLPAGWTGKVWAMQQGSAYANNLPQPPDYLLFMDADIACARDTLPRLIARAEQDGLALTSLMAKLRCETPAERFLIPAFVFFFQMLYPFAWVNDRGNKTAAAAGGCMLARRAALLKAGGIESIRDALIDDCALGRQLKAVGPIWLGLTERVLSLRPYPRLGDIRRMIARSAYDQLRYSPLLLAGTLAGMALTYLVPVYLTLFGAGASRILGLLAWAAMAAAFQPILRFYRRSPLWGLALPAIGCAYMIFTLDSACQHWRGRGGLWKGRIQANAGQPTRRTPLI